MSTTANQVAGQILQVMPMVMRAVREQMRGHRTADLSVTQFRVLAFVDKHAGTSLSDVADHIGLTLPSMSKLMDGLVARKLVLREFDTADRRRVTLKLTARGHTILASARAATHSYLAETLSALDPATLATIESAMLALQPLFTSPREAHSSQGTRGNGHT